MRKLLYIALTFLLLASCAGQRRYDAALRRAQAILNDAPDSALAILSQLDTSHFRGKTQMRYHLLRLMAQNKCDTFFTADTLQKRLADWYDLHGTPNERLWAHYLLGRACYDMDKPMDALREYQTAVSSADTTSADCDYWNLTRAYLNQLYVLYAQNLGREILSVLDDANHVAQQACDTPSVILCYEYRAMAYECLGKNDSMSIAGLVASSMYKDAGRDDMAARALAWAIPYHVEHGDYNLARDNMAAYERFSGYFDQDGHIEQGREHYYAVKGRYYLGIQQYDSAEMYLRRCLAVRIMSEKDDPMRKTFNCWHAACKGLSDLYLHKGVSDSVAKYARLSERFNDSLHARGYLMEALRMKRLYDYSEHLRMEHLLRDQTDKMNSWVVTLGAIIFLLLLAGAIAILYRYIEKKRYKENMRELRSREEVLDLLQDIRKRQSLQLKVQDDSSVANFEAVLRRNAEENVSQIDRMIRRQKREIERLLRGALSMTGNFTSGALLLSDSVCKEFLEMSRQKDFQPDKEQWRELERVFDEKLPHIMSTLRSCPQVSLMEMRVCMMIRLGISTSAIARLTGNSRPNVSMIKKRIYTKLTGLDGSAKELESYLRAL